METYSRASTVMKWDAATRMVYASFVPGSRLGEADANAIAEAFTRWIGADNDKFGVLIDAEGLAGSDGAFRARCNAYFKQHKERAMMAVIHVGPIVAVLTELFRIGSGLQLKTLSSETTARAWLRSKGIDA